MVPRIEVLGAASEWLCLVYAVARRPIRPGTASAEKRLHNRWVPTQNANDTVRDVPGRLKGSDLDETVRLRYTQSKQAWGERSLAEV